MEHEYKLAECIGSGAFGTVRRALHYRTGKTVAVKIQLKHNIDPAAIVPNEVKLLCELNHPNIVQMIKVYNTSNKVYIVMEHCAGGSLRQYLQKHPFPLSLNIVQKWFRQLLDGMSYLQRNRVIHRDIKPANILLTDNLDIKLADFGFARRIPDTNLMTSYLGTKPYMSPEMHNGQAYSFKSDVWSIGVVIYELLFRQLPFDCRRKIIDYTLVFPDDAPAQVRDLLSKLFAINPDDRPNFNEIKTHEFFANARYSPETPPNQLTPPRQPFFPKSPRALSVPKLPKEEVKRLDLDRVALEETLAFKDEYSKINPRAGLAILHYVRTGFKQLLAKLERLRTTNSIGLQTTNAEFGNLYVLAQHYIVELALEHKEGLRTLPNGRAGEILASNLLQATKQVIRKKGMIDHMEKQIGLMLRIVVTLDQTNTQGIDTHRHFYEVTIQRKRRFSMS